MKKKTKIFLGAFINFTNAQNLNCLALAKHLDKNKFEVFTLELFSGNLESQKKKIQGVNIFNCFQPFRISGYIGFLWGIWNCDVAYLPKTELWKYNRFLLKMFNKKSFSTIENILDDFTYNNFVTLERTEKSFLDSKSYFTELYSITNFMNRYNNHKRNIKTLPKTLFLGVNNEYKHRYSKKHSLSSVLMIGNDLVRKGVFEYLEIASKFSHIEFILAGSGNGRIDIPLEINKRKLKNVNYLGMITVNKLNEVLKNVQLHILPSRSEGFPKSILETAFAGVPSILYSDYGASEWISSDENGWVVNNKEEIISLLKLLENNSEKIKLVSEKSRDLAKKFDWSILVKDWEKIIKSLHNN